MTHTTKLIAAAAALSAAGAASAAHIDFFTESDGNTLVLTPGETSESETFTDPNGDTVLGNTRFTMIEFAPGSSNGVVLETVLDMTDDGILTFTNGSQTRGTLTLRYGDTATLDLVSNPAGPDYRALQIDVEAIDVGSAGGGFDLAVTALDTDGDSDTQSIVLDSAGSFLLGYDAFDDDVDFDMIDTLTFEFVGQNPGADIDLANIIRAVPEPGTMAAAGLLSIVGLRRRRQQA